MSSGGWELVGKNKKDKNYSKTAKLTKAEKKKFTQNAPKVEDFLPLNQVKTLYDNLESKKENKKRLEEKENKAKENHDKKKQHKPSSQSTGNKKKPELKGKPSKTTKDPSNMIDGEEFNNVFTNLQTQYPEFPLIWLKSLASYLSTKIPTDGDDPIFSKKPKNYPLSLLSDDVMSTLARAIDLAGQKNIEVFYEITLTTMCNNMMQGLPVIGHKIFLQLLNRKEIGLSLLWAISQAGKTNFIVNLKVWHEVVSPLLSNKTYTNYVVQILNDLVSAHPKNTDLTPELYFDIIEDIYAGKLNESTNLVQERKVIMKKLRCILFNNEQINYVQLLQILFGKINHKLNHNYMNEFVGASADCLVREPLCFNFWQSVLSKNLYQSCLLLSYLNSNWATLHSSLEQANVKEILFTFQTTTENWRKSGQMEEQTLIYVGKKMCQELLNKMTVSKQRTFPWKKGSMILILIICGLVTFDISKHESLGASNIGRFLEKYNIDLNVMLSTTKTYISKGSQAVEATFPEYYRAVVDFSTPYIKLSQDFYLLTKNLALKLYQNTMTFMIENGSVIERNIEHYFPGLLEEMHARSIQAFEFIKIHSIIIGQKTLDGSILMFRWFETNVFVGKLSPENLQSYANHAIKTTQTFASQTYDWVYEKVQTLSKVP